MLVGGDSVMPSTYEDEKQRESRLIMQEVLLPPIVIRIAFYGYQRNIVYFIDSGVQVFIDFCVQVLCRHDFVQARVHSLDSFELLFSLISGEGI